MGRRQTIRMTAIAATSAASAGTPPRRRSISGARMPDRLSGRRIGAHTTPTLHRPMVRQNAGHDKFRWRGQAPCHAVPGPCRRAPRLAETAEGWFSRADPDQAATGAAGERRRRGIRVLEAHAGVPGSADGLHGPPRLPERADVPRPARRGPDALAGAADHGGAEGQGPRARPLEPLPARERARGRPDQPRVRAALRGDGALPHRARGVQLLGAGHREHGGARPLRHRRAEDASGSRRCWTARSARPSR